MKRMVRAGLALGMSVCLAVTAMAVPADVSAKKKAPAPKKITLNKKSVKIRVGKKFTVKVKKVTPKKASKKASAFKFKSSKTKIATVTKKGVIKGKKVGSCKVTVTSKTKKKVKATIKVKVIKKVVPKPTSAPPVVPATNAPVVATTNPPAGTATDAPATDAPTTNPPAQETTAPATTAPATDVPATTAPATTAPATDAPATNVPATNVPATEAPKDEKIVDGVLCKSFKLDPSEDYIITAKKADGSVEQVELPLSELPALLNKVVDPASTYEKWMNGTGYRKTADGVSVKVDTPDDSQMQTKVVTVEGSANARLNGTFEVTITKAGADYTVNATKKETGVSVTAVITEGAADIVITGDYNGKSYRAVALKDKSNVKVYDKVSGDFLGQIEKTETGYDLDIEKGRAVERAVSVVELKLTVTGEGSIDVPETIDQVEPVTLKITGLTTTGETGRTITWEVADDSKEIISIDENGVVIGKKAGTATVKATVTVKGVLGQESDPIEINKTFNVSNTKCYTIGKEISYADRYNTNAEKPNVIPAWCGHRAELLGQEIPIKKTDKVKVLLSIKVGDDDASMVEDNTKTVQLYLSPNDDVSGEWGPWNASGASILKNEDTPSGTVEMQITDKFARNNMVINSVAVQPRDDVANKNEVIAIEKIYVTPTDEIALSVLTKPSNMLIGEAGEVEVEVDDGYTLKWVSDDANIATVTADASTSTKATITAVAVGKTKICGQVLNASNEVVKTEEIEITVLKPAEDYKMTLTGDDLQVMDPSKMTKTSNADGSVTLTNKGDQRSEFGFRLPSDKFLTDKYTKVVIAYKANTLFGGAVQFTKHYGDNTIGWIGPEISVWNGGPEVTDAEGTFTFECKDESPNGNLAAIRIFGGWASGENTSITITSITFTN